jgi:radical SAM enzyme (TIGR01210 family)
VSLGDGSELTGYPERSADRDRFIVGRRQERPRHDPWRHQGLLVEAEPGPDGAIVNAATVFLTGRECPWRCVMCDLWRFTTLEDTPAGAIPAQLDQALAAIDARDNDPPPSVIKLYNAGSFFDPRAVPVSDHDAIARRIARFSRVVVESHPRLVGPAVERLRDSLARHSRAAGEPATLEVAMGLETAHPEALDGLNKRMTLADFERAAVWLKARAVALRVFLLVHPPFVPPLEREEWLARSVDLAFACGATAVSLIPMRLGNGAMEALAERGLIEAPTLASFERAVEIACARARGRGRVFADLWDLDRLVACPRCAASRVERVRLQNLHQVGADPVTCAHCAGNAA